MSIDSNLLTSPWGEIQFLALNTKVKKYPTEDAPDVYTVRLRFDGSTEAGKAWRAAIEDINPNLIGTKHINSPDEFTVRAATQFDVMVTDANGNEMDDAPNFYSDSSSGTARMVVQPYTKNTMGGTINLVAVAIGEDFDPGESKGGSVDRSAILDQIRKAVG